MSCAWRRCLPYSSRWEVFILQSRIGICPLIGVDPALQGAGHGTELMKQALARCDADHILAYLETSNPRNTPFYERLGFERLGDQGRNRSIEISPDDWRNQAGTLPRSPMLRKPR